MLLPKLPSFSIVLLVAVSPFVLPFLWEKDCLTVIEVESIVIAAHRRRGSE